MEYTIESIELKTSEGENQETWTVEDIYKLVKEEIEILGIGNIEEFKISIITQIPIEEEKAACFSARGEIKELNEKIVLEDKLYHPAKPIAYPQDTKCLVKGTSIKITKIG